MSEKLLSLDPAEELLEAFECFDEDDSGTIKAEDMRYWLSQVGDKMSQSEIDKLVKGPPFGDRKGNFNYREFVAAISIAGEQEADR
jgi:myosin regulatory light chain 12